MEPTSSLLLVLSTFGHFVNGKQLEQKQSGATTKTNHGRLNTGFTWYCGAAGHDVGGYSIEGMPSAPAWSHNENSLEGWQFQMSFLRGKRWLRRTKVCLTEFRSLVNEPQSQC